MIWTIILLVTVLGWLGTMTFLSLLARRPARLGVVDGRLVRCPGTPNCVCSQAADETHRIDPITYEGTRDEAHARLVRVLAGLPRAQIVTDDGRYLHVEVRSLLFRFVDDVEFLFDEHAGVIHFRSASRVGRSDLGVNRARMEAIRRRYLLDQPTGRE